MACYEKDCHYVMSHDGDCFYEGLPMDKKENCPMYKAKTNGDRIRQMTDEELAEVISGLGDCDTCYLYHRRCSLNTSCKDAVLEWLRKEAD